jgi:PKD repeat protein
MVVCAIGASPDGGGSNMKKPAWMRRVIMCAAAIATTVAGCTMKSQETPQLTGPSELGVSISLRTQPEILVQDGSSQSLVTITARDENGRPKRDVSVISEIFVDRIHTDFGSLSARNLVTDANGEARLMYTAPALPPGPADDKRTIVEIGATPLDKYGTGGFGNSQTRFASIRLIPPGVVVPPDGLQPHFTVSNPTPADHETVFFEACNDPTKPPCAPGNNPIATYSWNFGDGSTATGRSASHSFSSANTFVVTLTVTDFIGRTASTSQTVVVSGGATPTASFLFSPASPRVGENVNFNASASRPATGRTIRTYEWDFGDGEQKTTTGPITSHDFQKAGDFNVTLVVTDDAGRQAVASTKVTIGSDAPTADFTFSQLPSPPAAAHTMQFNSATSSASSGRTITSYAWDFGDGGSSTLASPTHTYAGTASFNVTLTVTDSTGKTGRVTKTVQVQ